MKKFLFFATVVSVSLASCVNENLAELNANDNLQEITFEVGKYKASSRADGAQTNENGPGYTSLSQHARFGTFALSTTVAQGTHTLLMNNEEIGFVTNYWAAIADTYYWPVTGHVDFISYYPYKPYNKEQDGTLSSTQPAGIPLIGHVDGSGVGDFNKLSFKDYIVVQNEDLMFSKKAHYMTHNYKTYFYSGVPTLFQHALAKLNFMIQAKELETKKGTMTITKDDDSTEEIENILDWRILVKSITLKNIRYKGSVELRTTSPSPVDGKYVPDVSEWIVDKGTANISTANVWTTTEDLISKEWVPEQPQNAHLTATVFCNDQAKDYYVMPQDFYVGFEDGQYLEITYSVVNKPRYDSDGTINQKGFDEYEDDVQTYTKQLNFQTYTATEKVPAWEMGKNYTYTIIIDPKGDVINFDPAVTNWVNDDRIMDI